MYRIVLNETSYYGAGCRSVIADEIRKRGFKKVLLVTDKDLIRFGVATKIEEELRGADIPYEIYSQIKSNPTIRNVQQGVEAFKASGADCMVALGGGSSIDTAKAVGIIVNNGIVLVDCINQQRLAGMERRDAIIDAGVTRLRPILMTSLTTILGYSAMSGIIGGGGLGKIALSYGYYRYQTNIMIVCVVLLVLMVQAFQSVDTLWATKSDKRLRK